MRGRDDVKRPGSGRGGVCSVAGNCSCAVSFQDGPVDSLARNAVDGGMKLDRPQADQRRRRRIDADFHALGTSIRQTARVQLARALAFSGDKAKAKIAYQDFLTPWKNADPDIPILKQARAEFARLNEPRP